MEAFFVLLSVQACASRLACQDFTRQRHLVYSISTIPKPSDKKKGP